MNWDMQGLNRSRLDMAFAWASVIVRRGPLIVLLLVIFTSSAFLVDAFEAMVPQRLPTEAEQCHPLNWASAFSSYAATPAECLWQNATYPPAPKKGKSLPASVLCKYDRQETLDITVAKNDTYSAEAAVTMPSSSPIVARLDDGDAISDPDTFSQIVVGDIDIGNAPFEWSVPFIAQEKQQKKLAKNTSAQPGGASSAKCSPRQIDTIKQDGIGDPAAAPGTRSPAASLTLSVNTACPATIRITSQSRNIAGAQGLLPGYIVATSRSSRSISVTTNGAGSLTVQLAAGAAQQSAFPSSAPAFSGWLADVTAGASAGWHLLRDFAEDSFPAVPWMVLFLASRAGAFGPAGRNLAWYRMERLTGLVILAHLIMSAVGASITQEEIFAQAISSEIASQDDRYGLWSGNGIPVYGGTVVLAALVLGAAAWWSRPAGISRAARQARKLDEAGVSSRPLIADLLAPVGLAAAIWGLARYVLWSGYGFCIYGGTVILAALVLGAAAWWSRPAGIPLAARPAAKLDEAGVSSRPLIADLLAPVGLAAAIWGLARYGLWSGNGIPVYGGTVALAALVLGAAAWWSRPAGISLAARPAAKPDEAGVSSRPLIADLLAPVGLAAAIWGFARLVRIWGNGDLGSTGAAWQPRWLTPAVALPLAALLGLTFLAILALAIWLLLRRPLLPPKAASPEMTSATSAKHTPTRPARPATPAPGPAGPVSGARLFRTRLVLMLACAITPYLVLNLISHASLIRHAGLNDPVKLIRATGLIPHGAGWIFLGLTAVAACLFPVLTGHYRKARTHDGAHLSWIIALAGALTLAAAVANDGGYLPLILNWAVVLATGLVIGLAVVRIAAAIILPRPLPGRRYRSALAVFALLIAVPWGALAETGWRIGWWALYDYAVRVEALLGLLLVVAGAATLRKMGRGPVTSARAIQGGRNLGIAFWFIVLASGYTLAGRYSWPNAAAVAAAALGALLLMPRDQVEKAETVLGLPGDQQHKAVQLTLRRGAARRLLPTAIKELNSQVASGKITFAKAHVKIAAIERETATASDTDGDAVPAEQCGFGALASDRPWNRARWGLLTGTAIGAPWVVLGLVGTSLQLSGDPYPELAVIAAITPLVIRWAAYGLLFGYFFPLLRGTTGLAKAVWLLAGAAVPAVGSTLAASQPTSGQWNSTILLLVQLFGFMMTLGILADRAVLRKHGFPTGRLADLHNLWTVSAWASSVAVALATGVATVLIAGLQPFVIGVINPPSTPPHSATAPPSAKPSDSPASKLPEAP